MPLSPDNLVASHWWGGPAWASLVERLTTSPAVFGCVIVAAAGFWGVVAILACLLTSHEWCFLVWGESQHRAWHHVNRWRWLYWPLAALAAIASSALFAAVIYSVVRVPD